MDIKSTRKLWAAKGFGVLPSVNISNTPYLNGVIFESIADKGIVVDKKTTKLDVDGFTVYLNDEKKQLLGYFVEYAYTYNHDVKVDRTFIYYNNTIVIDDVDSMRGVGIGFSISYKAKSDSEFWSFGGQEYIMHTNDVTKFEEIMERQRFQINKIEELKLKLAKQIKLWSI